MDTPQAPLKYGALAPGFSLPSVSGQTFTREQFRGKSGLALIFFPAPTREIIALLRAIAQDEAEYRELNARVLAISGTLDGTAADAALQAQIGPFIPLLSDADGRAWRAYAQTETYGYAVFVLDTYGGVDAQQVSLSVAEMPDAARILGWVRAAQYRCSV